MFKLVNNSTLQVFFFSLLIAISLSIGGCDGKKAAKEEIEQKGFTYNFNSFAEAIESKNMEVIDLFIKAGIDLTSKTVQDAAFYSNDLIVLSKLIDAGLDPNIGNNYIDLIGKAVSKPEMLRILLKSKKLDINARDGSGYTPLMRAIKANNLESIGLLLAAKVDTQGALEYATDIQASEKVLTKLGWTPTLGIRMPNVVLDAIRDIECLKNTDETCNPNVIRINGIEDVRRADKAGFIINNHNILCSSVEECTAQVQALVNGGITNMSLGSYQINYKKYPNPKVHEYFLDATEREHVNKILTNLVKKHGYSWETIAYYHSSEPEENKKYYRRIYELIYGDAKK